MKNIKNIYLSFLFIVFSLISFSQGENQIEAVTLINKLRLAENSHQSKKSIKEIIKLDLNYDLVAEIIKNKINYPKNVKKGYVEWRYVLDSLDYLSIIFVPSNYSPKKKYPVSFILHGSATTYNTEVVKLWVNKDSYNCDSLERIIVYPGCWIICPWWRERQTNNLNYLLNRLKLTYNIDENNINLTGMSDGGTGIIYQANLGVTSWASFKSYISCPEGMKNLSNKNIYIKNLGNRPFLFISSEQDELFPPHLMDPFLERMNHANNKYKYILVPGFKHEIEWMPLYRDTIRNFTTHNKRNPYPSNIYWQTDDLKYNRNHWVIIDKLNNNTASNLKEFPEIKAINVDPEKPSGIIEVNAKSNIIYVSTHNVKQFTLLLSTEQFDFEKEITVYTNDKISFNGIVTKDVETLLGWFKNDLDREMLFGYELTIKVN